MAKRRSSIFDITDKLEIGRQEQASAASKPGFLSRGVMKADLNEAGTALSDKDRLNTSQYVAVLCVCFLNFHFTLVSYPHTFG